MPVPLPINEPRRLQALHACRLLDAGPEPVFERITATASLLFNVPVALITLIDEDRQWFLSSIGLPYQEISRDDAICSYTILSSDGMVIPDTWADPRFAENPHLHGRPGLRFYAGMPLLTEEGDAIGSLCVLDIRPREDFGTRCRRELAALAREAMAHVEMRRASFRLAHALRERRGDEARETLYCRVATAISEIPDLREAWQVTLDELCTANGWLRGRVWVPGEAGALSCLADSDGKPDGATCPSGCIDRAWDAGVPTLLPEGEETCVSIPLRDPGNPPAVLEFILPGRQEDALDPVAAIAARFSHLLARKGVDTRLREHEAQLSHTNRVKDHFLAMLAHELRNPLAPILNAVTLLRSPDPGDAIEIIERQVRHMARLMEDLLDVSRFTQGKLLLRREVIDLVVPVQAAVRVTRSLFESRGQRFSAHLPRVPLPVEADPVRIEQIVSNLLHNAAKYTPPGESIALTLEVEGEDALLCVSDTGMGIPPEILERIFEPFVQGPPPMSGSGLGIGLALVRQLITLHGGEIHARSAGPGHGSEFVIRLPLTRETPMPGTPPRETGTVKERRRRILVVEDNRDLVATLQRLLSHWGHEVSVVHRGDEAVSAALTFRPDVALIDIGLPGGTDGYEIARRLRAMPALSGIALLAVSGYHQEKDRRQADEAGFDDYLLKPVDPDELRERLAALPR